MGCPSLLRRPGYRSWPQRWGDDDTGGKLTADFTTA